MKFRPLAILAALFGMRAKTAALTTSPEVRKARSNAKRSASGAYLSPFRQDPDSRAFGQSETCRRMVRKNRMRRAGIGGARI